MPHNEILTFIESFNERLPILEEIHKQINSYKKDFLYIEKFRDIDPDLNDKMFTELTLSADSFLKKFSINDLFLYMTVFCSKHFLEQNYNSATEQHPVSIISRLIEEN